jgi:TonB family protein
MNDTGTAYGHRKHLAGLLVCASLLPFGARGQSATDGADTSAPAAEIQTEELRAPLLMKRPALSYPEEEMHRNGEGWVQLGLMVDPVGKPFEVTVVASSGDKVFEKEAVRAVEQASYQPGMLNGRPIESATQLKIVFRFSEPSTGASEDFVHQYVKLQKAVEAKDRSAADRALKNLEVRNLYEDAYFGLATFMYARQWGDEAQQLSGLRRAIAYESTAHYLSAQQFRSALVQCLALEVKLHHYAEAQHLWANVLRSGIEPGAIEKIKPMMQQLSRIRTSEGAYDVSGSLPDGTWGLDLYKRNFHFKVSAGHIAYVKLRCSRGFVRFAFDPDIQYRINSKYGDCEMELEGEVGTQFTLTQF